MSRILWLLLVVSIVQSREITIQTYNAGLNPRVDHMEERKEALIPALRVNGSDVVCLQEIWSSGDTRDIIESLRDIYPYSMSPIHDENGQFHYSTFWPPCFSWAAVSFATCAVTYCRGETTEEGLVQCVVSCGFVDVSSECLTCVLLGGSFASLRDCMYGFGYNFNPQGIVLMSKRPLSNPTVNEYLPDTRTLAQRAYIKADVENFGPVACTHMTPYLGEVYIEPSLMNLFYGWADQSWHEARLLVHMFSREDHAIIMGDLNTGPAIPSHDVQPHMADSYNEFVFWDWSVPYVDRIGTCTFCQTNVLTFDNESWILDHIMTKGHHVVNTKLVHTDNINGQNYPVSDHYGIEVTFLDES